MASAVTVDLYDWAFNIDGTVYSSPATYSPPNPGQLPVSINDGGFSFSNVQGSGGGLGTIILTLGTPGTHNVVAFFDHEIDEAINTYFNEYGATNGPPGIGQSWEIDEPYLFGDIYTHLLAGSLDNSNGVPSTTPDDVSMAMGGNFTLASGETAVLTLLLSETAPTSGFYLKHRDLDSNYDLYFSGTLETLGGQAPVPEPGTMLLLGSGLAGLVGFGRKKFIRKRSYWTI